MAATNPVVGFTPKAAAKIKRAVNEVLDGVPDFAALRTRRREVWDDGFWAVITCHCVWCTNKWKYSFTEVYRHCDQWIVKPNGRTGDCCGTVYALNAIEAYNDGTLDGNSVDYRISPGKMLPVQGSPVVWMRLRLGDDCTTDCNHNDTYNNSDGSSNARKSKRPYYSFEYINHDNTADKTPPTPVDCCHTSNSSSSSSSSSSSPSSSQPCCPCYLVTYTLAEPPAQLQQAGPTDWTNETDTIYIQKGGGGWNLTINGDTFTAPDGPCPPLAAEAWTPALPFNIECGSCSSSPSSSSPSSSHPSSSHPSSSTSTCGIKSITLGTGSGCTVTLDITYCDGRTEQQSVTLDCCSSCSCSCCPSCPSTSCPSCPSCPSCSHPSTTPSSSQPSNPSSSVPSSGSPSSNQPSSPSSSAGQLWTLTPCGGGTPIKTHEDLDSAIIGSDIVKWNGQCYVPGGPVPDDGTGINTTTETEVFSSCEQCQAAHSTSTSGPSSSAPSSVPPSSEPSSPSEPPSSEPSSPSTPSSSEPPSSTPSSSSSSSSGPDGTCYSKWYAFWNCNTHTWDIITQVGIECHGNAVIGINTDWHYVETLNFNNGITKCKYQKIQPIAGHTCHAPGDGSQGDCAGYNDPNTPAAPTLDGNCQCPSTSGSTGSSGGAPMLVAERMAVTPPPQPEPKPTAKPTKKGGCGCGRPRK